MLKTDINWFGRPCLVVCDRKCEKAWGHNGRRADEGSMIDYDEEDDVVDLADHEVGLAPDEPGTWEGGHGKPMHPERHNKWCTRECERSSIIEVGEEIAYKDFSTRQYNQPWKHPEAADHNKMIHTGETYSGPVRAEIDYR